jgi:phage terminase small subunit
MTAKTPKATQEAAKPRSRPKPPEGLGAGGRALWQAIVNDLPDNWDLDRRELHFLEQAGRCQDEITLLEAAIEEHGVVTTGSRGQVRTNPAVADVRALRIAQQKLLSALEMTDPQDRKTRSATPHQLRAQRAAEARWAGKRRAG